MKTRPSNIPPVPLPDFERISQCILGILVAEKANITASCLFFGIMSETILKKYYGLNAKAVVGDAAFNLTGTDAIAFSDPPHGDPFAFNELNSHCWVEVDGWGLDFSSIIFPEIVARAGLPSCQRLMFQKPLSESAPSISELKTKGSFHLSSDSQLTIKETAAFLGRQAYADLIEVSIKWYKKPPKKMFKMDIITKSGDAKPAVVSPFKLNGVW
jgi:Protein of unknown function (DUF2026)